MNRRKGQHKALLIYGRFLKPTKMSVWLLNQRFIYWLKPKPYLHTFWYLIQSDRDRTGHGNLKTPEKSGCEKLRSDPRAHKAAIEAEVESVHLVQVIVDIG